MGLSLTSGLPAFEQPHVPLAIANATWVGQFWSIHSIPDFLTQQTSCCWAPPWTPSHELIFVACAIEICKHVTVTAGRALPWHWDHWLLHFACWHSVSISGWQWQWLAGSLATDDVSHWHHCHCHQLSSVDKWQLVKTDEESGYLTSLISNSRVTFSLKWGAHQVHFSLAPSFVT